MFFNLGFGIKPDGVCCFLGAVINRINAIFFSAVLLASSNAFGTTYTASPSLGSYSAGGNVIRFKFTNPANSSAPSLPGPFVRFDLSKIDSSNFSGADSYQLVQLVSGVRTVVATVQSASTVSIVQDLYQLPSDFTSGSRSYYFRKATQVSIETGLISITATPDLDTTPPVVSVPSASAPLGGIINGTFAASDASSMTTVAVQLSRSGIFPISGFATCLVNASPVSPTVAGGSGTYSYTASNVQCPGLTGVLGQVIYYRSYAQDAGGYSSYSGSSFVIDPGNQPPALSSASATRSADGSVSSSVYVSDIDQNSFGIAAYLNSGGNAVTASRKCQIADCTNLNLSNGSYSFSWSASEMDAYAPNGGTFTVQFIATDSQGNSNSTLSNTFIVPEPFTVAGASPLTGLVSTIVPVTVTGAGFTSSIRIAISNQVGANCAAPSSVTSTSALFNCTLDTSGPAILSVRKALLGPSVRDFSFSVTSTPPAPAVSSVSPPTARLDVPQVFTVTGTGLTSGMGFTVADCDTFSEIMAGGTSTSRQYQCTPRAPGDKGVLVKTAPGGSPLSSSFSVRVEHPQRMGDSGARGNPSVGGVHLFNGNLFLRFADLMVPGRGISAVFERSYNSYDWQYEADYGSVPRNSPWRFNFETRIGYPQNTSGQRLYVAKADGSGESYFLSGGNWVPIDVGNFSTIKANANGTYTLQTRGQISYVYESPSAAAPLTGRLRSMSDRDGNTITYRYGANGKVDQVTDSSGRLYTITTDGIGRVTKIQDFTGRNVQYFYTDAVNGRIESFVDVRGKTTRYAYNASGDLSTITDPKLNRALSVVYTTVHGNRGVQSLTTAMGRATGGRTCGTLTQFTYCFAYAQLAGSTGFRTTVDGPENVAALTVDFDNAGRATAMKDAQNNARTTVFEAAATTDLYAKTSLAKVRKSALGIANGYQSDFTNSLTHGLLEVARDPESATSTTVWNIDALNNLFRPSTVATTLGHTSSLGYTASGRPNRITAPKQFAASGATAPSTKITWTNGVATKIADPNSNEISLTRDTHGNLTETTDPRNALLKTVRVYDALGRVTTVTDARNGVMRYTYDEAGNITSSTQEVPTATNIVNSYRYDDNGNMDQHTDPKLTVTTYIYDAGNRLTSTSRTVSGQTVTRTTGYDNANRLTSITNENGNAATRRFDFAGRVDREFLPLSRTTQYGYDADNRLKTITDPMGRPLTYDYDRVGRVTAVTTVANGTNLVQRYRYDQDGRLDQFTDARGNITTYGYDGNGNLVSVKDANNVTSTATYDDANRMLTRKDPRQQQTTYEYDKAGNMTAEIDPLGNRWEYAYDENGNVLSVKNPDLVSGNKRTTTHTYDAANRRISTVYSSGAQVTYVYDGNNNLNSMTDSIGTTSYLYDEENRLKQFTDPFGNIVKYTFDKAGNRKTVEYPGTPGQRVVTYGYDAAERMTSVLDWTPRQASYDYNLADQITKLTHGNGTYAEYAYDTAGRLTSLANKQANGSVISSHVHTLDPFGNITQADEVLPLQPTLTPRLKQWTIDNANRVLSDTVSGDSFEHDAAGRMVRQIIGGATTNFTYNDLDLLTNLGAPGRAETYRYNGQGHRLERTVNGVANRFLIEPNGVMPNMLAELSSANAPQRMYVYGANGLLAQIDASGTYRAYHFAPVGNAAALTNASGLITDAYGYAPFGESFSAVGNATENAFRFVGQFGVRDELNGLYYSRARYQSISASRFISKDPLFGSLAAAQETNPYSYTAGNPLSGNDPTGLCDSSKANCAEKSPSPTLFENKDWANALLGTADSFSLWIVKGQVKTKVYLVQDMTSLRPSSVAKVGPLSTVVNAYDFGKDVSDTYVQGINGTIADSEGQSKLLKSTVKAETSLGVGGATAAGCLFVAGLLAPTVVGSVAVVVGCGVLSGVGGAVAGNYVSASISAESYDSAVRFINNDCAVINSKKGTKKKETLNKDVYVPQQEITGPNSLSTNDKQIGSWTKVSYVQYSCVY